MDEFGSSSINSRPTFGGLATGLDTGALVDALMEIERRPLQLLQSQRSGLDARQTALQTLGTRLLALRDAARSIDNRSSGLAGPSASEELLSYQASSSDESILTVDVSSDAAPGSFDVRVEQLAQSTRRVSVAVADPDAGVENKNRNLTIQAGTNPQMSFSLPKNTTLNEIRDMINAHPDNNGTVQADVLFDGSGYRLIIQGTELGAANDVSVTTNLKYQGDNFIDSALGQDASDASLEYLGITVTRTSNDVDDLVPGVILHLNGTNDPADPNDAVEVSVVRDDDAIADSLQALVDAYNSVRDFSVQQTTLDADNRGGALIGDSLVRNVELTLQSRLGGVYTFTGNPFASLGQLGLSFDAGGRLQLDRDTLDAALAQDANAVREFLSGDGVSDGAATALARALEPIVQSGDGLIALRDEGIQDRIDGIDRQIERFEDRLALREETLLRRFAALESLVATLQAQSSFLGGFQT